MYCALCSRFGWLRIHFLAIFHSSCDIWLYAHAIASDVNEFEGRKLKLWHAPPFNLGARDRELQCRRPPYALEGGGQEEGIVKLKAQLQMHSGDTEQTARTPKKDGAAKAGGDEGSAMADDEDGAHRTREGLKCGDGRDRTGRAHRLLSPSWPRATSTVDSQHREQRPRAEVRRHKSGREETAGLQLGEIEEKKGGVVTAQRDWVVD